MKNNENFLFLSILYFQQKQPQSCQFLLIDEKPSVRQSLSSFLNDIMVVIYVSI